MSDEQQAIYSRRRRSHFHILPNIADEDLPPYEYKLYGHYVRLCGDENMPCVEGIRTTGQRCCMSPSTVVEARQSLERKGYLALRQLEIDGQQRVQVELLEDAVWERNYERYNVRGGDRQARGGDRQARGGDRLAITQYRREEPTNNQPKEPIQEPTNQDHARVMAEDENGLVGWLVGDSSVEEALRVALLLKVGMMLTNAKRLAAAHPLERIRRCVAHWDANKGERFAEHPGIIVRWLDNWDGSAIPDLPASFYRSALYRDFRTLEEIAAEAEEQAASEAVYKEWLADRDEAALAPIAAADADESPAAGIWRQVLAEIKLSLPAATFNAWMMTTMLEIEADCYTVCVANPQAMDWIRNRMRKQIERILRSLTGNRGLVVDFRGGDV